MLERWNDESNEARCRSLELITLEDAVFSEARRTSHEEPENGSLFRRANAAYEKCHPRQMKRIELFFLFRPHSSAPLSIASHRLWTEFCSAMSTATFTVFRSPCLIERHQPTNGGDRGPGRGLTRTQALYLVKVMNRRYSVNIFAVRADPGSTGRAARALP